MRVRLAFTRGRIIGKLEEGRSVTSVAAYCSHFYKNFKLNTYLDNLPEETDGKQREKSLDTTQATGRPISRFMADRGSFALSRVEWGRTLCTTKDH
ncbi:hypothetical protein TNCV_1809801 [Trichonephila clavipes]|nr:hypothetical protein TNCV_1809801 [Trichonephila clavipes]